MAVPSSSSLCSCAPTQERLQKRSKFKPGRRPAAKTLHSTMSFLSQVLLGLHNLLAFYTRELCSFQVSAVSPRYCAHTMHSTTSWCALIRRIGTTAAVHRSGHYKLTATSDRPLTYEQANPPYRIGVTKGWNSWNTSIYTHTVGSYQSPSLGQKESKKLWNIACSGSPL